MQNHADEEDEVVRKRQRNRMAQQKYRKRLKSHIEDLEKKAAVADQVVKGNEALLPADLVSSFGPFHSSQINGQEGAITGAIDLTETIKTSNATSASKPSPGPLRKKAPFAGSDSRLSTDDDVLRGFSLLADDLSSHKNPFFTDYGMMEIHEDNSEPLETLRFPTSLRADELSHPPAPPSSRGRFSTASSVPQSLLEMPPGLEDGNLEARVDYVLRSIENVGFSAPDSFMSTYYTASFNNRLAVHKAQEISRNRGLPMMLDELRSKSDDWSIWQSRAYTDSIVRSAAFMITDEFNRLTKTRYQCEKELKQGLAPTASQGPMPAARADSSASMHQLTAAAAELKKTLRNELPNLTALIATLSGDSPVPEATRVHLLLATIKIIAPSADEPLQEAANWVYHRVSLQMSMNSGSRSGDDFEGGSSSS